MRDLFSCVYKRVGHGDSESRTTTQQRVRERVVIGLGNTRYDAHAYGVIGM